MRCIPEWVCCNCVCAPPSPSFLVAFCAHVCVYLSLILPCLLSTCRCCCCCGGGGGVCQCEWVCTSLILSPCLFCTFVCVCVSSVVVAVCMCCYYCCVCVCLLLLLLCVCVSVVVIAVCVCVCVSVVVIAVCACACVCVCVRVCVCVLRKFKASGWIEWGIWILCPQQIFMCLAKRVLALSGNFTDS